MSHAPNRLARESSLYLRQHANNPVDWYPWGPEALTRAKELDRPIFLSIGYSACHWCHVMERESFEDEATASILNAEFVSIKVDREERPDLDAIYMAALQALTREGGGWPLSVWLTPDGHPFYAGTYYPPDNRYGRPGFKTLLRAIADAWRTKRKEIAEQSADVVAFLNDVRPAGGTTVPGPEVIAAAATGLRRAFDATHGGFGRAPKFPHALEIRLLLRAWKRFGDATALHMARHTLDKMAAGGMYDQVGGGFHRYSTDERWLVPHFEKMLYDNALLASAYVEAWQATQEPEYERIARETFGFVTREMTDPSGAFYSTLDADSEGEEGKFYVWTRAEVESVLGPDADLFCRAHDITPGGNWEGHNIPNRPQTWDALAGSIGLSVPELKERCETAGARLYVARAKRVWPGRDEKVLTAWNGLMTAAFAQAGAAFGDKRLTAYGLRSAEFVLKHLRRPDGRLFRTCAVGRPAKLDAYLEDYAFLIEGLLSLYHATFDPRWVNEAVRLADVLLREFGDPAGGLFYTGVAHERLVVRTKDSHDGSTPSGNSMAATALSRLAILADRPDFAAAAEGTLAAFAGLMSESPGGTGQMLSALDFHLGPVRELVLTGDRGPDFDTALSALRRRFLPTAVVVAHPRGSAEGETMPLLRVRQATGPVTLYVCERGACQTPEVGLESVVKMIGLL
ncbi:MAG TPA: thioredoxin domain-containing protein [Gemmataceae bacterium]|nr:thioredoxin domain-containing protein [Gemmataceae bacterium]